MNLILTGATGFLGSHLLKALLDAGHCVSILKRTKSDCQRIEELLPACEVYNVDMQEMEQPFQTRHIDAIIHCATAYGHIGQQLDDVLQSNLLFPLQLMETAISHGCKYFINTDTFFCKQLPNRLLQQNPLYLPEYTLSKYQFRQWGQLRATEKKLVFIDLQLEHVFGATDGSGKFIPWLEAQFKQNVPYLDLTDGIQLRDFVPVEAVVPIYLQILQDLARFQGYQQFEVGTGKSTSVRQFVEQMKERVGAHTELRFGSLARNENEIMYSTADVNSPYLVGQIVKGPGATGREKI